MSPGLDRSGVCRGHRERGKCFFVSVKSWCPYLILLQTLCPSHSSPWDTLPCKALQQGNLSFGWIGVDLVGGQRWTAGLPCPLLLCPFPDGEREVWRVDLTYQRVECISDGLLESNPIFSPGWLWGSVWASDRQHQSLPECVLPSVLELGGAGIRFRQAHL